MLGSTEVKIVDVTDAPREAGAREVGEIWIRGASKCRGYWQRPELTAAVFEARLPGESGGAATWLRSGDLGFLLDDELYVCGRTKDMLIVRGLNYYPQDVELLIEADPFVRKGCVAAFASEADGREALVVVAELKEPQGAGCAGAEPAPPAGPWHWRGDVRVHRSAYDSQDQLRQDRPSPGA